MTLREYLNKHKESGEGFAKRCILSYNTVKKVLHGECVRKFVAKRIARATQGEVPFEDIQVYESEYFEKEDLYA